MIAKLRSFRLKPVHLAMVGSLIAAFASQGALIVSGVLTARLLGPENRGHIALLILLAAMFSQVGTLGLPLSVTFHIAQDTRRAHAIVRSLTPSVAMQVVAMIVLLALTLRFVVANASTDVQAAAVFTVVVIPALVIQRYSQAILRGQRLFGAFNVLRVVPAALNSAALAGIVLVDSRLGLQMVALVWVTTNTIAAAMTLAVVVRTVSRQSAAEPAPPRAELVGFGLKGFVGSLSSTETFRLDQAAIGFFLPPAALGLYVTALAFSNLPRFISYSIALVASPHIAAIADPAAARRSMWRFVGLAVATCASVVLILEISAGFLVPFFFGEAFAPAVVATQVLLVHALIRGVGRVLGASARGAGHAGLNSLAEVAETMVLVPSLLLMVPRWDIEGAALALVGAALVRLIVLVVLVQRSGGPEHDRSGASWEPATDA